MSRPYDLDGPAGPLRSLGAAFFAGAVRARKTIYDLGLKRTERVDVPVISVGNLTVGGNGKTPFAIYLAQKLEKMGARVAVLSRGYGRKVSAPEPVLAGDEGRPILTAMEAGDEPILIVLKTRSGVVVCPDRVRGAKYAIAALGVDVLILDDGFQHWRLERDLDILMVDAKKPFGNGHLLPAGSLRERPQAAERADLIVVNRGPGAWRSKGKRLSGLPGEIPQVEIGLSAMTIGPLLGGFRQPAATVEGKRVALLAAIAKPERFEKTVRGLGAEVVHRHFIRDHEWMSSSDIDAFIERSKQLRADYILTTEKDATRLRHSESSAALWTLEVEPLLLAGETALDEALGEVLKMKRS